MTKKVIVLFSGGLDSTTLLYHLRAEGHEVKALSANYRQRHLDREIAAAEAICTRIGIEWRTVDLTALVGFFGGNALTNQGIALPEGGYAPETIGVTLVPNRNMVLLSVGIAWAAIANRVEMARLLIERGADVNHVDKKGMTPLLYAASIDFGDSAMIDLLLKSGARATARTKEGLTALDLARKYKHAHLLASLEGLRAARY